MQSWILRIGAPSFKPIPDEEGTETKQWTSSRLDLSLSFKPIPDEEGTETEDARIVKRSVLMLLLQTDPR